MSEDMPSSWRYLTAASARVSSIGRGYINATRLKPSTTHNTSPGTQAEAPQSWKSWAGQKFRLRRGTVDGTTRLSNEKLNIFPGWAVRRYRKPTEGDVQDAFEVEVFVSGFAISHRPIENASRSQRTFIRLAKGFAALPKLTADAIAPEPVIRLSPSTEALLQQKALPPRPTEITEDYVMNALERQLQHVNTESSDSTNSASSSRADSPEPNFDSLETEIPTTSPASLSAETLRKLHDNLESRLQPFWSSVLASRTVRLYLFASPHHYRPDGSLESENEMEAANIEAGSYDPVVSQDVVTAADGSFQARFIVKWEDLCQHPGALHIAFGNRLEEHDLLIAAQIQPPVPSPSASTSNVNNTANTHELLVSPIKTIRVPITHSPIRVISDIDDTVKLSNVILGARAVFQNVFVKELRENIIPGMGQWYTSMWKKGVRFHYVSNGPFEILPIINEFLQISQLPRGSIRLKSYAGRTLFNGLISAPATRKRAGLLDVLTAFPESRFFLIGDSGEQDLELYAELARERPRQILAVFIRDVESGEPLDDPTGWKLLGAVEDTRRPRPRRTLSNLLSSSSGKASPAALSGARAGGGDYFTSTPLTAEPESTKSSPGATTPAPPPSSYANAVRNNGNPDGLTSSNSSTASSVSSPTSKVPEAEKRRHALQTRVYLARTQMPGHVPLRIFRNPSECVEAEDILAREGVL